MGLADKLREAIPERVWLPRPEVLAMPNIPMPMSGVCPRVVLGGEWWEKTRLEAYQSTGYHCIACGVPKYEAKDRPGIEGHEAFTMDYPRGLMTYVETVPLCNWCHQYIHDGRMRAMVAKGEMPKEKMAEILEHGRLLLRSVGMTKPLPYEGKVAPWRKWRMVCFGKKYPPRYRNEAEWRAEFGR